MMKSLSDERQTGFFLGNHRGGSHAPPRWFICATAVVYTHHRGGVLKRSIGCGSVSYLLPTNEPLSRLEELLRLDVPPLRLEDLLARPLDLPLL